MKKKSDFRGSVRVGPALGSVGAVEGSFSLPLPRLARARARFALLAVAAVPVVALLCRSQLGLMHRGVTARFTKPTDPPIALPNQRDPWHCPEPGCPLRHSASTRGSRRSGCASSTTQSIRNSKPWTKDWTFFSSFMTYGRLYFFFKFVFSTLSDSAMAITRAAWIMFQVRSSQCRFGQVINGSDCSKKGLDGCCRNCRLNWL